MPKFSLLYETINLSDLRTSLGKILNSGRKIATWQCKTMLECRSVAKNIGSRINGDDVSVWDWRYYPIMLLPIYYLMNDRRNLEVPETVDSLLCLLRYRWETKDPLVPMQCHKQRSSGNGKWFIQSDASVTLM